MRIKTERGIICRKKSGWLAKPFAKDAAWSYHHTLAEAIRALGIKRVTHPQQQSTGLIVWN